MTASNRIAGGHALLSDSSIRRTRVCTFAGAGVLSSLALMTAASAQAQQQQPAAEQQVLEEIQVTGSRIERTGFTTPVPVTTMQMEELSFFEPAGGLSEQLNELPQFIGNQTPNQSSVLFGTAGQSRVNMRGMGSERTLVLLDGIRIVPSDRDSSVNPDYLPSALIRRVEVVTGGASAAYGADALAGVTNFIIDREFTGFEASLQGGVTEWGDGESWRASAAFGTPIGERLHIIGSLETRENSELRRGFHDVHEVRWAQDWGYVNNPEWLAATPAERTARQEAGEFLPQRLTRMHTHSSLWTPTGLIHGNNGFEYNRYNFMEDGVNIRPFQLGEYGSITGSGTFGNSSGGPEYWQAKRGFQQGPSQNEVIQRSGFVGFNFDLNESVSFWGNGIIGRIESNQSHRGNPENQGIWHIRYSSDNPFLPAHIRQAMIDYTPNNTWLSDEERDLLLAQGRGTMQVHMNGFHSDIYGNGETNVNVHDMWSLTGGAVIDLGAGWNLQTSLQYGESGNRTEGRGWERMDRVYMALDTVWADPETGDILEPGAAGGVAMCRVQAVKRQMELEGRDFEAEMHAYAQENIRVSRHDAGADPTLGAQPVDFPFAVDSVDNSVRDCVPFNLLGLNNASQEAVDYVRGTDKSGLSSADQIFLEVMATGTLYQGWGAGPIQTALGATYREESVARWIRPDLLSVDALGPPVNVTLDDGTIVLQGLPPGYEGGSPNLHNFSTFPSYTGGFEVWEAFNETIVPLYTSAGGEQRVELQLAGRYANYSRAGGHWVYKGGLDFQIFNDLRFRGTYSRDFREATFREQFDLQGGGGTIQDPEFNDQTFSITTISGGNPDLEPEVADTTVLGFVYQPSFAPGLSMSADWYHVDQTSRIGSLGAQRIVEDCYDFGVLCDRVFRGDDGTVQRVLNTFINIHAAKVEGIDLELTYRMTPNFFNGRSESLSFRALGGRLLHRSNTNLGADRVNIVGSGAYPEWITTGTVNYNVGNIGVRLTQNWQSSVKRNINWEEGIHVDSNRYPSEAMTNLGLSYNWDNPAGAWRAGLNVNNLFDKSPYPTPGFSQRGGGGTGARGDTIGRRYTVSLRYNYQ